MPTPPPPEHTRWPKGVSGNPGGRPKKHSLMTALEAELDAKPELLKALVQKGLKEALKGDFRYWSLLFDRIDGKVTTRVEISDKPAIDWSSLDNECDTPPRKAVDPKRVRAIPDNRET